MAGVPTGATVTQLDAQGAIDTVLKQYGLSSLSKWAWQMIVEGNSAQQIAIELYQQPAFEKRFPGIFLRMKLGFPPIDPTTYIAAEDAMLQLTEEYGLPRSILTPEFMGQVIGHDVSTSEFTDRIQKGFALVENAPPEVRQVFNQWFGHGKGDAQLAAFFLNPDTSAVTLEKEAAAASIQGAGVSVGVNIGKGRAERIAQMGDSYAQVQSALANLQKEQGLFKNSVSEQAADRPVKGVPGLQSQLTESGAGVDSALGLSGAASQAVEQRVLERANAFKGGGGAAQVTTQGYVGLGESKPF